MKKQRGYLLIVLLFFCVGCKKKYPHYDSVPQVEFQDMQLACNDSDFLLRFSFLLHDGDGNIGLEPIDTVAPYVGEFQQNFYAYAHSIEAGDTTDLPYEFSYRIPRLREEGNDKFIKATVSVDVTIARGVFPYDSVYFTYFIYDRDLNKSNIDTSAVIVLP